MAYHLNYLSNKSLGTVCAEQTNSFVPWRLYCSEGSWPARRQIVRSCRKCNCWGRVKQGKGMGCMSADEVVGVGLWIGDV